MQQHQHTALDGVLIDLTPARLADLLDGLVKALLEDDRESALILTIARNDLRNLGWNRYAKLVTRQSRARVMRRRHQGQPTAMGEVSHA